MFCPNCGKKIADNAKFCGFCGSKLVINEQEAETSQQDPISFSAEDNLRTQPERTDANQNDKHNNKIRRIVILVIVLCAAAIVVCLLGLRYTRGHQFQNHVEAGQAFMSDEDYVEAVAEFSIAIDIDPNVVEPYILLADAYDGLNDIEAKKATYDRAREMIVNMYQTQNEIPEDAQELYVEAIEQAASDNDTERINQLQDEIVKVFPEEEADSFKETARQSLNTLQISETADIEPTEGTVQELMNTFKDCAEDMLMWQYSDNPGGGDETLSNYEVIGPVQAYSVAALALREDLYTYKKYEDIREDLEDENLEHGDYWILPTELYEEYIVNMFGSEYSVDDLGQYENELDGLVECDSDGQFYVMMGEYINEGVDATVEDISEIEDEVGYYTALVQYRTAYADDSVDEYYMLYTLKSDEMSDYGCVITGMSPAGHGEIELGDAQKSDTEGSPENEIESSGSNAPAVSKKISGISVSATSQLDDYQDKSYSPTNLFDGDLSTAYVEGVDGVGAGEEVTITLDGEYYIDKIIWYPGYQSSLDIFGKNGYPTQLTFYFSDGTSVKSTCDDNLSLGDSVTVDLNEKPRADSIRVVIDSAVAGNKYEDTCISEIEVYGYK